MENGFLLILVGIIGIIVGFALGMGVASLRATPPAVKKPAHRSAPKPVARAATQTAAHAAPAGEASLTPSSSSGPPVETPPGAPLNPPKIVDAMPPVSAPLDPSAQPGGARRPSLTPVNVISRALQADVRAPDPPNKSIAAQVDEILQEMLKDSPLAARAIKLMEFPGKGMVVMVGLNQYDGVDAVPDEDIRKLIRSAAAEWERRATQSPT